MIGRFAAVLTCAITVLVAPAGAARADGTGLSGTLADGATWVADVPQQWNRTLILYSHGYGSLTAQDAPDATTRQQLLDEGYGLVGSSYSGKSLWALESAVRDQFGALRALERETGRPRRVIAWGTSMGGLVSALEAQDGRGVIDGALTTCGLVAGALNLNAYQLYGEYALAHLLAPDQEITLVRYADQGEAATAAQQLTAVVANAQSTPQGRARIALGAALLNEPGWYDAATPPADPAAQEQQQEAEITAFTLLFTMTARQQVELAAGGNSSATVGVDFARQLGHNAEVSALYRAAGLDLGADLRTLTRDADITADPVAIAALRRTSMVDGTIAVPELDIHTIADQLVPVEQENWYRSAIHDGDLRQAYVQATGHCAFAPAETIAALHSLEHRLDTGRWTDLTGQYRFVRYAPGRLNGAVDPTGPRGR